MKYLILSLFIFGATLALGQSPADIRASARPVIDTLCSPELGGRGYLADGHIRAANWIAGRLARAGVVPAAPDGSYIQPFSFSLHNIKASALTAGNQPLRSGYDYIPHSTSGAGKLKGRVADMGHGLAPGPQVRGKIALIRAGWPPEIANNTEARNSYQKLAQVQARIEALLPYQPAAVLILQEKLTASFSQEAFPIPVLEVRTDAWPAGTRIAALSVTAATEEIRSQNVMGLVQGAVSPDTVVVISAHYDHLGRMGGAFFPGANDNASGTAMLLDLAAWYADPKHQPRYSLLFITFGAEEAGLIGSQYYVLEQPAVPLSRTRCILNLDLMGNGGDGIMAVGGVEHTALYQRLTACNDSLQAVPLVKARANAPNSDHYFFLRAGVPGLFIYTMGGPKHYHDVHDTPANLELLRYGEIQTLLRALLDGL
ncbi:MAG: M28 family peptidase [Bacteroidia bacterium]|nr:M28 family peptidase [Bacteroidia bacterium]